MNPPQPRLFCLLCWIACVTLALGQKDKVSEIDRLLESTFEACAFERVVVLCDSIDLLYTVDQPAVSGYIQYWRARALYEMMRSSSGMAEMRRSRSTFRSAGAAYIDAWARSQLGLGNMEYDQAGFSTARNKNRGHIPVDVFVWRDPGTTDS